MSKSQKKDSFTTRYFWINLFVTTVLALIVSLIVSHIELNSSNTVAEISSIRKDFIKFDIDNHEGKIIYADKLLKFYSGVDKKIINFINKIKNAELNATQVIKADEKLIAELIPINKIASSQKIARLIRNQKCEIPKIVEAGAVYPISCRDENDKNIVIKIKEPNRIIKELKKSNIKIKAAKQKTLNIITANHGISLDDIILFKNSEKRKY